VVIDNARDAFLRRLCTEQLLGHRSNKDRTPSVSDETSQQIGQAFLDAVASEGYSLAAVTIDKPQTIGSKFGEAIQDYLDACLNSEPSRRQRPTNWLFKTGAIAAGRQYQHLEALATLDRSLEKKPDRIEVSLPPGMSANPRQRTVEAAQAQTDEQRKQLEILLHGEYLVDADLLVLSEPMDARALTRRVQGQKLCSKRLAEESRSPIVARPGARPHCHANVSCKFTLRNDRGQNVRTEAIQLARQRRGPMPRMVVVTAEVWPGRLESLAKGTGEIDCVYHVHLPALVKATAAAGDTTSQRQLQLLIDADRLRDVSALPLDLLL
jgi:hypothetical protein